MSFPFWSVILTTHVDGKYPFFVSVAQLDIPSQKLYICNMGISGASEVPRLISIGMLSTSDDYVVRTNEFLKSSSNPWAQNRCMLVRRELINVVLLSENHQLFAKITKNALSGHTSP